MYYHVLYSYGCHYVCMMVVCRYVQYDVSYVELLCVFMYVFMYLCMSVVAYPVQFRVEGTVLVVRVSVYSWRSSYDIIG